MMQRNEIAQHDLADLASQIKASHRMAEDCAGEAVGHALEAGKPHIAFFMSSTNSGSALFITPIKIAPGVEGFQRGQ